MKILFTVQKLLNAASVLIILFAAIPLYFIQYSLKELSWNELSAIYGYYLTPLVRTILLATVTGVLALIFAAIAMGAVAGLRPRFRKLMTFMFAIPLLFPPYIAAISYIDIFKSPVGLGLMGRSPTTEFFQAASVLSLFLYPYSFLLIKNRFEMIDSSHRKIISIYPWGAIEKIRLLYWPHLKGALFNGFLLTFMYVVADFGAVSILRMDTLTTELYQSMVLRFEYGEGSLLSLILLGIAATILIVGSRIISQPVSSLRKNDFNVSVSQTTFFEKITSYVIIIGLIFFSVIVPFIKIFQWFIQFIQEKSALKDIWFDLALFTNTIITTVVIALIVVSTSQIIAFLGQIAQLFSQHSHISKVVYYVTSLLHALPAIVIVFSILVFKYTTPFAVSHALFFLFFAYVLRYIGVAFLTISPAVMTIPHAYLRIGATFIPNITEQVRLIVLPYTKKYLFQSGNYIYLLSLRELTIPLILLPLGMNVLSVQIWQTAGEGLYVYASPAILVLLMLSLPSLIWYIRSQT